MAKRYWKDIKPNELVRETETGWEVNGDIVFWHGTEAADAQSWLRFKARFSPREMRAKRRTMSWQRRGRQARSRVPYGSPLQRVRFSGRGREVVGTMNVLMTERYCDLGLVRLWDKEDIKKHGGYIYLITAGATAHTAFRTEGGLERFLKITGLRKKFVRKGERIDIYVLEGCYERISLAGTAKELDEFGKREGLKETKILSNAEYTKAFYGGGKIYYLNPNYPRKIYPYFYE